MLELVVADALVPLLSSVLRRRAAEHTVTVPVDGVSSLVHVVESTGIPRSEIGRLEIGGVAVERTVVARPRQSVTVLPVVRPQRAFPQRYLLDVHLGALARRMRLVGLDTSYRSDSADAELVSEAIAAGRVLLTRDRGLLRRRALPHGAFVRGADPDEQLADVLDRFAPTLAPWTRCPRCNGRIEPVDRSEVDFQLEPGTRATYDEFSRCRECGRAYWRGAHASALEAMVRRATVIAAVGTHAGGTG